MSTKPLTKEKAIEHWTALQHAISVGAFEERSSYHHETGTWPEDGIEESLFNLENFAAKQWQMEFCWDPDLKTWSLVPIEQGSEER